MEDSRKKIEIKLPYGTLVAQSTTDPEYPGVYVYLERPDGVQVDLVLVEYKDSIQKLPLDEISAVTHYYECNCSRADGSEEDVCMCGTVMPTVDEAQKFLAEDLAPKGLEVDAVNVISRKEAMEKYGVKPHYSMPVFERDPYSELTAYLYSDIYSEEGKKTHSWSMKDIRELEVD